MVGAVLTRRRFWKVRGLLVQNQSGLVHKVLEALLPGLPRVFKGAWSAGAGPQDPAPPSEQSPPENARQRLEPNEETLRQLLRHLGAQHGPTTAKPRDFQVQVGVEEPFYIRRL